jgi:hypothetical protein
VLDRAAHVVSIALGHRDVEKDEVRMLVLDDDQRLLAVGCGQQLDAIVLELLECLLDEQPDVMLVVGSEDRRHGSLMRWRTVVVWGPER